MECEFLNFIVTLWFTQKNEGPCCVVILTMKYYMKCITMTESGDKINLQCTNEMIMLVLPFNLIIRGA